MEKIKYFINSEKGKDIMIVIIVVLVGLSSFGLGRLSKNDQNEGIKIEYPNNQSKSGLANTISALALNSNNLDRIATTQTGKSFFASTRGTKYYSLGCSAGKTIKQENRIYFATASEAEAARYTLSSSCN